MIDGTPSIVREVCFWIYSSNEITHEGRFLINRNKEVSCFGEYMNLSEDKDSPSLFHGLMLEHELIENNFGSILIKFYKIEPTTENVLGYKQVLNYTAALSMGDTSGIKEKESVMLGEELEFVFKTHTYS